MDGIDEHVTEAIAGLPIKEGDGIPWFAITEPDGNVLAISRGPMGNIGFPSSAEEIRHFRQMLDANRPEDEFRRSGSTHQLAFIAISGLSLMPTYSRRQIVVEDKIGVHHCTAEQKNNELGRGST